jgi:hypothetical protein
MKNNYRPLPKELTINRSMIDGLGVFAVVNIEAGINLGTTHWLIGDKLYRSPLGGYLNHSDNPNTFIDEEFNLFTVRDINTDEELTVFYRLTV